MPRISFLHASVIFMVLIFSHIEGDAQTSGPQKLGGALRIGLRKDIVNLNPLADLRSTTGLVFDLVYESLVENTDKLEILPSLAESWTISKGGTEYVFQLRRGVLFHNGKELDAEDVQWCLEYILDRKNRAYAYSMISPIETVAAPEKYSVKITLKEPFTPLLATGLSGRNNTVIVPKNSVKAGQDLILAPPGTGPFEFVEWKKDREIRLGAHKKYWTKGVPYVSELVFKPVPSGDVRFVSLRSGDLDLVEEVPYQAVNEIKAGEYPSLKLTGAPVAGYRMLKMNTEAPYFKDPRVRRAVAYAIDRKAFIEGAAFGHGEPAYQVYPKGWKWYFDDVKNIEMDLERAKALLAEAGYPNGFKAKLQVRQGEEAENMMLQNQLKKVGIDLELQGMDFASYLRAHRDGTYGIVISGSSVYPDIDRELHYNLRTESQRPPIRNNTRYSNPEVDRLLDRARMIPNSPERRELYRKATQIIINDAPHVNIAFITRFYGYGNHVKGFNTNADGDFASPEGGLPVTWVDRGR
jgi:peptide/nickel transport system substrate-binding protein